MTQREAAAKVGVSRRTLQRWIYEETKAAKPEHEHRLSVESTRARKTTRAQAKRLGIDLPPGVPVLPPKVYRPMVRDYAAEERRKEKKLPPKKVMRRAFTAQYDLKGQSDDDILALLKMARKKRRPIRFTYRVPKSKDYPDGVISTSPENVSKLSDEGLLDYIQEVRQKSADALGKRGRLVRLHIADPAPRRRRG